MKEIKIEIKCIACGFKKTVGKEQTEQPMCDKCYMPMIAQKATISKE